MNFKRLKKGDLVFTEEKVSIVVNGRFILRRHEDGNGLEHKIIASYHKGSIIGFKEGDNGLTNDCNIWVVCASTKAEVIEVDRTTFNILWKLSKNTHTEVKLIQL